MLIVLKVSLPVNEKEVSFADVCEYASLAVERESYSHRAVLFVGGRPSPDQSKAMREAVKVEAAAVYTVDSVLGAERACQHVSSVLAHRYQVNRYCVYDCVTDILQSERAVGGAAGKAELADALTALTSSHQRQHVVGSIKQLERILALTDGGSVGCLAPFRLSCDRLLVFMKTLNKLMVLLSPEVANWAVPPALESAFDRAVPAGPVQRLRESVRAFGGQDPAVKFASDVVSFFNVAARCAKCINEQGMSRSRDAVRTLLGWFSGYSLGASKQALVQEDFHLSILYSFRALEFFVLADLWRKQLLVMDRGTFRIHGSELSGFSDEWSVFLEEWSEELPGELIADVEVLKKHRNRNFLIHGLASPGSETASHARALVKGVIYHCESRHSDKLFGGAIGVFVQGEKWGGSIGDWLADQILIRIAGAPDRSAR